MYLELRPRRLAPVDPLPWLAGRGERVRIGYGPPFASSGVRMSEGPVGPHAGRGAKRDEADLPGRLAGLTAGVAATALLVLSAMSKPARRPIASSTCSATCSSACAPITCAGRRRRSGEVRHQRHAHLAGPAFQLHGRQGLHRHADQTRGEFGGSASRSRRRTTTSRSSRRSTTLRRPPPAASKRATSSPISTASRSAACR